MKFEIGDRVCLDDNTTGVIDQISKNKSKEYLLVVFRVFRDGTPTGNKWVYPCEIEDKETK